ncbi:MAG: serine hydrolase domain-containing protein [Bacteroidota bacterium]
MKNTIIIFAFIFCFLSKAYSQPTNTVKINIAELDSFINKMLIDWKVPGLALAIVKDGKVLYTNGYGVKNLKSLEKVSTSTLFSIASATKSFTSTLAAMMYEENKFDWDVPLINYFPDFKMYDEMASAKITLKDLMSHRSGIPRQKYYSLIAPANRKETRSNMKYFEPTSDFRASFNYCNETFAVAGDMIAERAGTTWEEMVRKKIFEPLEMKSTITS